MKKISLLLLIILLPVLLCARINLNLDQAWNSPYGYQEPTMTLTPYDAASGISMSNNKYPERGNGSLITWVQGDLQSWTVNPQQYINDHIVALGTLYDIPKAYTISQSGDTKKEIAFLKENPEITITAVSTTDFMFISQSQPSYRRPFALSIIPTSSENTLKNYGGEKHNVHDYTRNIRKNASFLINDSEGGSFPLTYDGGKGYPEGQLKSVDESVYAASKLYAHMWFDLILSLPMDRTTETGIVADGITYELAEAEDYTSIVYITMSYTPVYEVYEVTYDEGSNSYSEPKSAGPDIIQAPIIETIALPFSGFYSRITSTNRNESSASFFINTYPAASSLSLNPSSRTGIPRTLIDIADIYLLYNLQNLPQSANKPGNDSKLARIFLSASPSATNKSQTGFMFVHEGATSISEGRNAVGYTVYVRDNDATSSPFTVYDGTTYVENENGSYEIQEGKGEYLNSYCHITNPISHVDSNRHHYHSFDGTVSILIDDTNELMEDGIYKSNIYVHLVTEEVGT